MGCAMQLELVIIKREINKKLLAIFKDFKAIANPNLHPNKQLPSRVSQKQVRQGNKIYIAQ